jgi:hypothetical protein
MPLARDGGKGWSKVAVTVAVSPCKVSLGRQSVGTDAPTPVKADIVP